MYHEGLLLTPFLEVWVIPVRFFCVVREFHHQCSPNSPRGAPAAGLVESDYRASVAVVSNNSYSGVSQSSGVLYNVVLFLLRWVHSAARGPKNSECGGRRVRGGAGRTDVSNGVCSNL